MARRFGSLRKTLGVLTLMLACGVSAAWILSLSIQDDIGISGSPSRQNIVSMDGFIIWSRSTPDFRVTDVKLKSRKITDSVLADVDRSGNVWSWERCGFAFGASSYSSIGVGARSYPHQSRVEFWQIPYWFITVMPTPVSAYLLLKGPQKLNPGSNGGPREVGVTHVGRSAAH